VTEGAARSVRAVTWTEAHGIAAACVGLLLLVGTTLPTLTGTGPAFSVDAMVPAGGPTADTDGTAGARDRATGNPSEVIADRGKPKPTHRLDINRADADALQTLPGIGPALARQIVAYRAAHGPFRESGDLLRVPGIGAKRYAGLQEQIRIAEGP
jgi:competence ComEA-like helix-hairpin-helix protein